MRKAALLLLAAVLSLNLVHAQTGWITYNIDAKLSIQVPAQPTKADQYSVMSISSDSTIYIITKVDMTVAAGLDSAALAGLAPTEQFATEMRGGMQEKLQGYTLGDIKPGKWNGYYSFSIDADNPTTKLRSSIFMIIIGSYLYSFSVVLREDRDPKLKDLFFNSLKLN